MLEVIAARPDLNKEGVLTIHRVSVNAAHLITVDYARAWYKTEPNEAIMLQNAVPHVSKAKANAVNKGGPKTPCASMVGIRIPSNTGSLDNMLDVAGGVWTTAHYDPRKIPDEFFWRDGQGHWNILDGCLSAILQGTKMAIMTPMEGAAVRRILRETMESEALADLTQPGSQYPHQAPGRRGGGRSRKHAPQT